MDYEKLSNIQYALEDMVAYLPGSDAPLYRGLKDRAVVVTFKGTRDVIMTVWAPNNYVQVKGGVGKNELCLLADHDTAWREGIATAIAKAESFDFSGDYLVEVVTPAHPIWPDIVRDQESEWKRMTSSHPLALGA